MRRRALAVLFAATALLAAACGDDGAEEAEDAPVDDTSETTEAAENGGVPMGPADLTVEDQTGDGSTVEVASVTLPAAGFIAVHADSDGSPGAVIGHSDLLPEGESTDVTVTFDEPLTENQTVWPMAHIDTNGNDSYDFDPPDSTEDGPATFEDGDVAVAPLSYTVEGDGGDGSAAGEGASVTIDSLAFQGGSIEVSAGTTVTWTNEDSVTHTVTAGEPGDVTGEFDETVEPGESVEITFDEPGTYPYFCAIHPGMTAEVVVS